MANPDNKSPASLSQEEWRALMEKARTASPEEQQVLLERGFEAARHLTPEERGAIVENGQKILERMTPEEQQAFMQNWRQTADNLSPQQQQQLDELLRLAQEKDKGALVSGAEKTTGSVVAGAGDKPLENDKASEYKNNNRAKVEQAQKCMMAVGIDCGPADGKFGPLTEKGVRAFEERMGIKPPDGKLSENELKLLEDEAKKARAQGQGKERAEHSSQETKLAGKEEKQSGRRPHHGPGVTDDEFNDAMRVAGMGNSMDRKLDLSEKLTQATGVKAGGGIGIEHKAVAYLEQQRGVTVQINGRQQHMSAAEAIAALDLAGHGNAATDQLAASVVLGIENALAQAHDQGITGQTYASADVAAAGRPMGGGGWRSPDSVART